ncbi:hypothetical protein ALC60_13981, partial [Trachymyrmex zeteki]
KRSRGRPRKDGSGPFRSPSIETDASIGTRMRGRVMEGLRAARLIQPTVSGGEDAGMVGAPLRRVHIPSSSFFCPVQRREVDRCIALLHESSTTDVAGMVDNWLTEAESARARSGTLQGGLSGKLKMALHLSREAALLLACRAMETSVSTAIDVDRIAVLGRQNAVLRGKVDCLQGELDKASAASRYLRRTREVPGVFASARGSSCEPGPPPGYLGLRGRPGTSLDVQSLLSVSPVTRTFSVSWPR